MICVGIPLFIEAILPGFLLYIYEWILYRFFPVLLNPQEIIGFSREKWTSSSIEVADKITKTISNGYDLTRRDENGKTILHHLTKELDILKMIVKKYNLDINVQDNKGKTPIMYMSFYILSKEIITSYFELNPNILIKNKKNENFRQFFERKVSNGSIFKTSLFDRNLVEDQYNEFVIFINNYEKQRYSLMEMIYYSVYPNIIG